jgi:RNA polymerase sigma factor (sigma-70 family)
MDKKATTLKAEKIVNSLATNPVSEKNQEHLWETISNYCNSIIRAFVLSHQGSQEDVNDVIQDTFLYIISRKKWRFLKRFRCHKESYIIATAKNIWHKELLYRSRCVSISADLELPDDSEEVMEKEILYQKQFRLYRNNLNWMSDECRKVLKFSIDKMPSKTAAQKLGYSEEAYRKRKLRYISALAERIKKDPNFFSLEY